MAECTICGYPYCAPARKCPSCNVGVGKVECYITTAVCLNSNLPDDCAELTVLRRFRDGYMMETTERRKMVEEYYERAPKAVATLKAKEGNAKIYTQIKFTYIDPAVKLIQDGRDEEALLLYKELVDFVEEKCASQY